MDFGWGPADPASGGSELNLLDDAGAGLLLGDIDERTLQVRPAPIRAAPAPSAQATAAAAGVRRTCAAPLLGLALAPPARLPRPCPAPHPPPPRSA